MFTFAGARCYVGPATPVLNPQAEQFAKEFGNHLRIRPIMFALFRAQRTVYEDKTRPYLMIGTHFTTLGGVVKHAELYRNYRLGHEMGGWNEKGRSSTDEHVEKKSLQFARFLRNEMMRRG